MMLAVSQRVTHRGSHPSSMAATTTCPCRHSYEDYSSLSCSRRLLSTCNSCFKRLPPGRPASPNKLPWTAMTFGNAFCSAVKPVLVTSTRLARVSAAVWRLEIMFLFSSAFNVCETCIGWIPADRASSIWVTGFRSRPNQATRASVMNCRLVRWTGARVRSTSRWYRATIRHITKPIAFSGAPRDASLNIAWMASGLFFTSLILGET